MGPVSLPRLAASSAAPAAFGALAGLRGASARCSLRPFSHPFRGDSGTGDARSGRVPVPRPAAAAQVVRARYADTLR